VVSISVKALPKKSKHQMALNSLFNLTKASILTWQALWYSSCIATYILFMYLIAYDFFVLYKPISEINPTNFAGAIATIVLIWAGPKILKPNQFKVTSQQQMLMPQKPEPQSEARPKPQEAAPAYAGCPNYFGYLNQRERQQEIPDKCLMCRHVIECMNCAN
jgi:hypothetical protein